MDHSSEKRDLCSMKRPSETLQTAIYLEYENPPVLVVYSVLHFLALGHHLGLK